MNPFDRERENPTPLRFVGFPLSVSSPHLSCHYRYQQEGTFLFWRIRGHFYFALTSAKVGLDKREEGRYTFIRLCP